MKVLLLNTYTSGGGAAVAAQRMLQGLLDAGIDARMLVATAEETKNERITAGGAGHQLYFIGERIQVLFATGFSRSKLFRFSSASMGMDISQHPWVEWADIIHLHWVQHGFISLHGLEKLFKLPNKKFYWTLHDLWPITGGCHIPYIITDRETNFCNNNRVDCLGCPLLTSSNKLAHRILSRKRNFLQHKIHYLGVSSAVTKEIETFHTDNPKALPPKTIPNIIDHRKFYPTSDSKQGLRLLFVAARVDDPVKGLDFLKEILTKACQLSSHFQQSAEILMIGRAKHDFQLPIKVQRIERVTESELRTAYNSAHITLSTSRYETFGQTLLESIACGTPALSFRVGGTSDIIQDGINGSLIPPYDTSEYARQLLSWIERAPKKELISGTAELFYAHKVITQLINMYQEDAEF